MRKWKEWKIKGSKWFLPGRRKSANHAIYSLIFTWPTTPHPERLHKCLFLSFTANVFYNNDFFPHHQVWEYCMPKGNNFLCFSSAQMWINDECENNKMEIFLRSSISEWMNYKAEWSAFFVCVNHDIWLTFRFRRNFNLLLFIKMTQICH